MPWVLVAIAVVWALSLMLILALCLSARRLDTNIRSGDDVATPSRTTTVEAPAVIEDISSVRRPAPS